MVANRVPNAFWTAVISTVLCAASFAPQVMAGQTAISMQFQDNAGNNANNIVTGTAGAVPVANWNTSSGANGTLNAIKDSTGTATTANVTWASNNTWSNGTTNTGGNDSLMRGYLDDGGTPLVTITNIPYSTYDVIVYSHGDAGNGALQGKYFVDSVAHAAADTTNFQYCANCFQNQSFSFMTIGVNYMVFHGLTSPTCVISPRTSGGRAPMNGFQIVSPGTSAATTGDISCDFVGRNGQSGMASTEYAGVAYRKNWNTLGDPANTGNNNAGTLANLADESGTATSASVTWGANDFWSNGNPDTAGQNRMMRGYIAANGTGNTATIQVTGLPVSASRFTNYDIYCYIDTDSKPTNGTYALSVGAPTSTITFTNGQPDFNGQYVQSIAGSSGNYIVFTGISGAAFTITGTVGNAGNRTGYTGFQIIDNSPAILTLTPAGGLLAGGDSVVVAGNHLLAGSSFTIGGSAPTSTTYNADGTYTLVTPAHAAGAVNVVYSGTNGTFTLVNGYTYAANAPPAITTVANTTGNVIPATGPTGGGTNITITGTNFRAGATVQVGGTNGFTSINANTVIVTATTITCNVPAAQATGSVGPTRVTVTNSDATNAFVNNAFIYTDTTPTVTSISPNTGAYNATTNVTITGTKFAANLSTGGGSVTVGGQLLTNIVIVSSTSITGTVQAMSLTQTNPNDVVVTNPGGTVSTGGTGLFTYSGLRVPENDTGLQNMIYYRYFHDPAIGPTLPTNGANAIVPLAYTPAIAVNKTGFATTMEFNGNPYLPDGVAQYNGDATWTTDNYSVEYRGFLKVPADGIWTLYTASDDASFFMIGDQTANTLVVSNNFSQGTTERSGTIALKAGFHRFIVQYSEGNGGNELRVRWSGPTVAKETLPQGSADGTARGFYTESTPVLSTANPSPNAAMPQGGGQAITVTGTGFGSFVTTLVIKDSTAAMIGTFNNPSPAPTFTVVGATTVVPSTTINGFNSPATTNGGPASVTVTTLFGQTATLVGGLPNGLTYLGTRPTLVANSTTAGSTAPASGPSSGNLVTSTVTLTATAANFTPSGVFVKIDSGYNGYGTISSAATIVTGIGTNFTAQIQAGDSITASGQTQIVASVQSATSMTMTGSFSPVLSGASFTILKAATTAGDLKHITFIPPPHITGAVSLSVINGDGLASNNTLTNEYTYVAPTISSITTTTPSAGTDPNIGGLSKGYTFGGNTVTIVGTNFGPTTIVTIGGNAATSVAINSNTVLTCVVPANTSAQTPFNVNVVVSDNQSTPSIGTLTNGYQYIAVPATLANATGKVAGVVAKYFANGSFTIPNGAASGSAPAAGTATLDGLTPALGKNINTSVSSLGTITGAVPANSTNFYVKVSGYLKITTAGTYTLFTSSDDASLLYLNDTLLNNTLIVNNNVGPQGVTQQSGKIALGAGLHPFTILYGQGANGYDLSFAYSGPDTSNVTVNIPDAALFADQGPTVISVSPATGSTFGGTTVTVTGTGFVVGAQVSFGTVAGGAAFASNVTFVNSTTITCNAPSGANGAANVVVTNPNGAADSGTFTYDNTLKRDPEFATPAAGKAVQGVLARYYKNLAGTNGALPTFAGNVPFRVAPEQAVQGTIGEIVPDSSVNGTVSYPQDQQANISFQFNGYLNVPYDGTWTLYTSSDDGSNLYIGNTLVVNNNFSQGITTRSGTIGLKAGLHAFTLQFCNGGGGYGCYFSWGSDDTPPNGVTQIPTSATNPPAAANRIPSASVFYVPPTFVGGDTNNNWSSVNNWNTNSGLGAYAPNQTDTTDTGSVSTVLRFNGNGGTPYTAVNDSVNPTPFYILELNSNIIGNVISGNTLKTLGTGAVVKYDGTLAPATNFSRPAIIKNGSGTTIISAPLFNRDSLVLAGNGTGIVTLSGTQTNYNNGTDIKNIYKIGSSIYVMTGTASAYVGDGVTNTNGFLEVDGGVMGINSVLGTAGTTAYNANVGVNNLANTPSTIRGTGTVSGIVKVGSQGTVFPGDPTAANTATPADTTNSLTSGPLGNLTVGDADLSNAGTLLVRVNSPAPGTISSDTLTVASGTINLANSNTLAIHVQASGNNATPSDTLVVDLKQAGGALNATPFSAVTVSSKTVGGQAGNIGTNLQVLYVNSATFTPGSFAGIVGTHTNGGATPSLSGNFDRVYVRLTGNVTPVTVDSFTAQSAGAGVLLTWNCVSEFQNAGFNVYRRSVAQHSGWSKVNPALVAGRITSADQKSYNLYDWALPGSYDYKLESVSTHQVAEAYSVLAGPVVVDAIAAVTGGISLEGISAAESGVELARNTERTNALSALFANSTLNAKDEAKAQLNVSNGGVHAAGRSIGLVRAKDELLLKLATVKSIDLAAESNAPVQNSAATKSVPSPASDPFVAVRGFNGWASSTSASFTGTKVVYQQRGVLLIPSASLPVGLDSGHMSVSREGRSVPVLSQATGGVVVLAPGYEDDYTNHDALFLRSIAAPTVAGRMAHVNGLFANGGTANVNSPAQVTTAFHDVYYDYNSAFRPFTFPPWFSGKFLTADAVTGTTQSFTVTTPFATSSGATLTVNLFSLPSTDSATPAHALQVVVNGVAVGQAAWNDSNKLVQLTFQIPSGALVAGDNAIDLVTPTLAGVDSQTSFLHSLTCDYTRTLDGSQATSIFNKGMAGQLYEVSNLPTSNVWVVDARFPDRAALVPYESVDQGNGTFKLRFVGGSGGSGEFVVVPQGMENAPLSVTQRQVKPLKKTGTYLAVGPNQFRSSVQPLLIQRAKEGLRGQFVDQEQLFDYYNYGRYGPAGIQNAVRSVRPKYLLLVGRTTYDYKNYSGLNIDPLCPSFLVSTSFWAQTTSDSMFGDLGSGYPEVSVGRLPVNTVAESSETVKHILNYAGVADSGWRSQIVADAADPMVGDFAAEGDEIIAANPSITWDRNYFGVTHATVAETAEALRKAACGGADFIIYNGHGNAARLGKNSTIADVNTVQTWTGDVVLIAATCTFNWSAKLVQDYRSIPLQALSQPQGGIAASIGTTTYMNSAPEVEFVKQVLKQSQGSGTKARWGDVLLRSQQWAYNQGVNAGGWYRDLSRTECLLGDPAMPLHSKSAAPAPDRNNGAPTGTF